MTRAEWDAKVLDLARELLGRDVPDCPIPASYLRAAQDKLEGERKDAMINAYRRLDACRRSTGLAATQREVDRIEREFGDLVKGD